MVDKRFGGRYAPRKVNYNIGPQIHVNHICIFDVEINRIDRDSYIFLLIFISIGIVLYQYWIKMTMLFYLIAIWYQKR